MTLWSCGVKICSNTNFISRGLAILPIFPSLSSTFFHWTLITMEKWTTTVRAFTFINGEKNSVNVKAVGGSAFRANCDCFCGDPWCLDNYLESWPISASPKCWRPTCPRTQMKNPPYCCCQWDSVLKWATSFNSLAEEDGRRCSVCISQNLTGDKQNQHGFHRFQIT